MLLRYLRGSKRTVFTRAAALTLVIALVDWRVELNLSFGFLYMFPMLLAGTVLSRWQILCAALVCSSLSDLLDPFPFMWSVTLPQDILVFVALAGTGLFSAEATRSQREMEARREAEDQLKFLIASNPVAILTMNAEGRILLANDAAHRLFANGTNSLTGRNISQYVAALGRVPSPDAAQQTFRTEMQCRGERENGEVFVANVFFSTYRTMAGPRLAALVVDGSDDLREREEFNHEQLLAGSRVLVGAVSHEIRNVCGAIAVIHENLGRGGALRGDRDFEALGALVDTLHKIASLELNQTKRDLTAGSIDLTDVLGDLRIVLEPYCQDSGITVEWDVPEKLPPVWADSHSLLQVLLNLTKNSERAMKESPEKRILVSVKGHDQGVALTFSDSGPGLVPSDQLFQPFQKGADSTGLGLYLSRAFLRSFGGELRLLPSPQGCSFVIELVLASPPGLKGLDPSPRETDTALVG